MKLKYPILALTAEALFLIIVLQALREAMEYLARSFVPDGRFAERMTTMCAMMLLTVVVILYARLRKTPLSVFPARFGKGYIIFTCIATALLISAPSNFTGGYQALLLLLYGSVVTPIYEELIFRGYLWNRLSKVLSKEIYTYIWSVVLFTVWHIGYMIPQITGGNWTAVLWKLAAGVGYGAVLGFVRLKTKNCYSAMLVHGVLNVFMI